EHDRPVCQDVSNRDRLEIVRFETIEVGRDVRENGGVDVLAKLASLIFCLVGTRHDEWFALSGACHSFNEESVHTRTNTEGEDVSPSEICPDQVEGLRLYLHK